MSRQTLIEDFRDLSLAIADFQDALADSLKWKVLQPYARLLRGWAWERRLEVDDV